MKYSSRSKYLADRLNEVFINGRFIANTNYTEQLSVINWKTATFKIDNLNSIALLTFHINYYLDGLLHFFEDGRLEIKDKYSFDAPAIQNEEDWQQLRKIFFTNALRFIKTIETFEESVWDENFVDEKYGSYLRNIDAMIEHSYYHLGQIVMLTKWITEAKE